MPLTSAASFPHLIALSAGCLAVSVVISACEYIAILAEFRQGGAFCWRFVEVEMHGASIALRGAQRILLGSRTMALILAIRIVSGCSLMALSCVETRTPYVLPAALACIFATGAILQYRCTFGLEGGDLMSMVVCAGLLVSSLPGSQRLWPLLGLSFIAAQSCLSYCASGAAKLASPMWRSGRALYRILRTGTFGHRQAATLLRDRTVLSLALCWGVMIFEVTFPLLLLVPFKIMIGGLALGALFHIVNAFLMGLNTFCWSFLASYPGIVYCHGQIHALLR